MKPLRLVVLLLSLPTLTPGQEPGKNPTIPNLAIEKKYDRFADTTSVSVSMQLGSGIVDLGGGSVYVPSGSGGLAVLGVVGIVKGNNLQQALPLVSISLTSKSADWKYLRAPITLRLILNGQDRLSFGEMKRVNGDVLPGGRGVIEQLVLVDVPFSAIEKIARAEKVEIQIGSDEFELRPTQITDLKEWAQMFPAAQSKPTSISPRKNP